MEYQLTTTIAKDGTEIYILVNGKEQIRLNSIYAPLVEAQKFAQQYKEDLSNASVVCIFGYGNGMFYKKIKELTNPEAHLICWEPCAEIVHKERKKNDENIFVAKEDFEILIKKYIDYINYNNVVSIVLPKYKNLFFDDSNHFYNTVYSHINRIRSQILTAKHFGHKGIVNNIKNMRYLADSYCIDSYKNKFPVTMPVFIVSAGPSLEKNKHLLKEIKGKALILCVDTAVKYLINENIYPDFIVSIDPNIQIYHVNDDRIKGLPIIGCSDMNCQILDYLESSKVIFASTENEVYKEIYRNGNHNIPSLKSGGSVSTFAYMLCLYLGFKIIVLLGQDLALTGQKQYAGEKILNTEDKRNLILVESVDGSQIYTTQDYYFYLKWFENQIKQNNEIKVIDATEGGAKIAGCKNLSLQEAIDAYVKTNEDVESYLQNISKAFDDSERRIVVKRINDCKNNLLEFQTDLKEGIELLNKICDNNCKSNWNALNDMIKNIFDKYDTLNESFLIQREIDSTRLSEYLPVVNKINDWNQSTENIEYCRLILQYFKLLYNAIDSVINEFAY